MKEIYDAAVLTAGAIAISFASKKLTKSRRTNNSNGGIKTCTGLWVECSRC